LRFGPDEPIGGYQDVEEALKAYEIIEAGEKPRRGYQAFELSEESRNHLAGIFPPKFPEFIGHHITYAFGVMSTDPLPEASNLQVVGYACDSKGIEALIVSVDGSTDRPDGKTFHITWSLDRSAGFKPVNSNDLIANNGWNRIRGSINITAKPRFF